MNALSFKQCSRKVDIFVCLKHCMLFYEHVMFYRTMFPSKESSEFMYENIEESFKSKHFKCNILVKSTNSV